MDREEKSEISWQQESAERFLGWAKQAAIPLSDLAAECSFKDIDTLSDMIGDATVVGVSEAVHGGAEPLKFRNRLFEYLVQEKGFTAIALESGIVEGRSVYDYVRAGRGTLAMSVARGISWTFDRLSENHDLVAWMRAYNADPGHSRKINFYAFDVPGSPGEPNTNRGLATALTEVLEYLVGVDPKEAEAFHARLNSFIPSIHFDFSRPLDAPGYDLLSQVERDSITAAIADLVALLERREALYKAASSVNNYEWVHRAAIGARQTDAWLRQIPIGWKPSIGPVSLDSEQARFLPAARDVRDRAQADNLEWIIGQEGPPGKILVFAHRYHLSAMPVKVTGAQEYSQQVMGTYLRSRLGNRLLTIGHLIGQGEVECAGLKCGDGTTQTLRRLPRDTIEGLAGEVGTPHFLLDLRTAPAEVAHWLKEVRPFGRGRYDDLNVAVGEAFDWLFYMDTVTAARCNESAALARS